MDMKRIPNSVQCVRRKIIVGTVKVERQLLIPSWIRPRSHRRPSKIPLKSCLNVTLDKSFSGTISNGFLTASLKTDIALEWIGILAHWDIKRTNDREQNFHFLAIFERDLENRRFAKKCKTLFSIKYRFSLNPDWL